MLLICRILQGMSVGGQLPASLIYTVESKPKKNWGYYGSLVMVRYKCESNETWSELSIILF